MRITPSDIVGAFGILPTPATPDASHWSTTNSVNLPETEKMTRYVVESGVEMIMTTGTFGECSTLTSAELQDFVDCVVRTVAGRRPVFAGITTLNTRDTISRGKKLMEAGADGLFIGRPMWLALDEKMILRFYRDIAEAMPDVPYVIYDNPLAFKGKISSQLYGELAKIPQAICAKHTGSPDIMADAEAAGDRMRLLPVAANWVKYAKQRPDLFRACWSGSVACAATPIVALSRAVQARDWDEAERIMAKCAWAEEAMFAGGDFAGFMNYSIPIAHLRFTSAGIIDPGPPRPPYIEAPPKFVEGGLECGRRWATLEREFAPLIKRA